MILNKQMGLGLVKPYDVVIVAFPYNATGNCYVSFDKGSNWTSYSVVGSTSSMVWLAVVKNSILMGRTGTNQVKTEFSTDLWVNRAEAGYSMSYPSSVCISEDEQVFAHIGESSGSIVISTNKGSSWAKRTAKTNCIGMAMKSDGSKIWISNTANSKLAYSTDYGQNWTDTGYLYSGYVLNGIGCSADGNYIYAGVRNYGDRFVMSSDGGANWSSPILVGSRTTGTSAVNMSCSSSGQYVFFETYSQCYVSADYGSTWTRVLSSYAYTYSYNKCVSYSGKYMATGDYTVNNQFYFSENYGVTWGTKSISGLSVPIRAVVVNEYY